MPGWIPCCRVDSSRRRLRRSDRDAARVLIAHRTPQVRHHDDPTSTSDRGPKGPVWRVRHETVALLRSVEGGGDGTLPAEAVDRAARLLAAHIREILGREIPSAGPLFGPLEP